MLLRYFARLIRETTLDEVRDGLLGGRVRVQRLPVGVVAGIVPWNFPQVLTGFKLGPLLAMGCTVVLKPSPETVLDAALFAEAVDEAGLPPGVINIVPGGRETGRTWSRTRAWTRSPSPVGPSLEDGTQIGPMVSSRQRERVEGYIAKGTGEGARLTTGGGRPAGLDRGWFVEPTVFADVENSATIAQEEIFGPVLSVIRYADVEDAVRIANDSAYGLGGTVWTSDPERGADVAARVQTGTIGVNGYRIDPAAPYGGIKSSGLGRELGPEGLASYQALKSTYLAGETLRPRRPAPIIEGMTSGIGLLDGKVVLVTGAGRGIGAAAARLFAAEGASVVLASRTEAELAAVTGEVRDAGGTAEYVVGDLATAEGVEAAVRATVERFGRLDAAFNNAGTSVPHGPMVDLPEEDFDLVTRTNQKGVFLALRAEVRAIRETTGRGAVVNNSSVGSSRGAANLAAYGATKRAVNALTEAAAVEYGPEGIRVNAIAPGTTMTAMMRRWAQQEPAVIERLNGLTPLRRAAEPTEVAEAAAWLLSDRASYVTGVVLWVDGGMRA